MKCPHCPKELPLIYEVSASDMSGCPLFTPCVVTHTIGEAWPTPDDNDDWGDPTIEPIQPLAPMEA